MPLDHLPTRERVESVIAMIHSSSSSSYFDGWKEYEKNPSGPVANPGGIIQMGLAENQLSLDLMEELLEANPDALGLRRGGASVFRELALFQDYQGMPAFKNALASFMSEQRGYRVTFDPSNIVLMFCLADHGDAFLIPTTYYPGKFYLSPKVDNKLEAKHKPIQLEPDSGLARNKAPPNTMLETKEPDVTIMPFNTSDTPEPGTIHKYNHGIRKRSYSGTFNTSTNKKTSGSITTNPRQGEKGFVLHSADSKANPVIKNISVITRAGSGGSSSEGTGSALTRGNDHHSSNDMPLVILDNQAQVNCTGVFSVLSNLRIGTENIVLIAANGGEMETFMSGSVNVGNFELPEVHYCPDLGDKLIVSGSMLDNDDYGYEFRQGKFTVKDLKNDTTVGEGHLIDGNYILDYLKIPRDRTCAPEQRSGLVTTVWNAVCSAFYRMGLKY